MGEQLTTVANTGINYNALKVVSNILAKTDTFKIAEVDIFSIPSTGSLAQIIETVPTDTETRAANADVTAQSYANGTTTQIGISQVYGLNVWKGSSDEHPWPTTICRDEKQLTRPSPAIPGPCVLHRYCELAGTSEDGSLTISETPILRRDRIQHQLAVTPHPARACMVKITTVTQSSTSSQSQNMYIFFILT